MKKILITNIVFCSIVLILGLYTISCFSTDSFINYTSGIVSFVLFSDIIALFKTKKIKSFSIKEIVIEYIVTILCVVMNIISSVRVYYVLHSSVKQIEIYYNIANIFIVVIWIIVVSVMTIKLLISKKNTKK